ncbi:hypothetical protein Cyagr_1222 [Cyanobium gracile PCC 6307]|uniref:Tyrosine specific protein phosphatases domain-containing protein n=2 Tax=Cyanobium gracile TaxID=59930 RepID=K9P5M0_CYAGP|nr:hypothetical protein Cyagr_1222 [Cyanobium gracile PCC 6307]
MVGPLRRFLKGLRPADRPLPPMAERSLPCSWVLTGQLAIGPMPRSDRHWRQLEEAGIRSRFSCCYQEEETALIIPAGWRSDRISLPDHRAQEPLLHHRLALALARAEALVTDAAPVYLHCMAGYERSPLLAVGLTARLRGIDLLAALAWVRRCHPMAMPIYDHLVMLEGLLSARQAPGEQRGTGQLDPLPGEERGP